MLPSPSAGLTKNIPTTPSNVTTVTTRVTGQRPAPIAGGNSSQAGLPGLSAATTLKRPAASDLQRCGPGTNATPSKRQATSTHRSIPISIPLAASSTSTSSSPSSSPAAAALPQSRPQFCSVMPPPIPVPGVVTEDQLRGRTPEQLIATILQIQLQHQQYVAHISAQYENISQQLNELRGSLVASYQSAASALVVRENALRSVVPVLSSSSVVGPPRPSAAQTPNRPLRAPAASPGPATQAIQPVQTPQSAGPPQYDYRTVGTVEEVWREYREGMGGQPAIELLDQQWGSRWRPEPRGRTWYSRRKVIWDKIKECMGEGMDEDEAVREVERLRDGGTINKLIRMLQDERKDKGLADDSMVG